MTTTAQASRVIPANADEVWERLTSSKAMKSLGAEVETDWRVGGPITLHGKVKGQPYADHGEVRSFLPHRRLSYTHTSDLAPGKHPSRHLRADAAATGGGMSRTPSKTPTAGSRHPTLSTRVTTRRLGP